MFHRLIDLEEKHELAVGELHIKSKFVSELEVAKARSVAESNACSANLNQALLHSKQACSQLETRNQELELHQKVLLEKCEDLQRKSSQLTTQIQAGCLKCLNREQEGKKIKDPVVKIPAALTVKPIPEHTELDRLLVENNKLKQKHDCLYTNFQIVSEKSMQLKKELKEKEKEISDLQIAHDSLASEKEEYERKYSETRQLLFAQRGHGLASRDKQTKLESETAKLEKELDSLQSRLAEFQDKHSASLSKLRISEDSITNLNIQLSKVKSEKAQIASDLASALATLEELQEKLSKYQQAVCPGDSSAMQQVLEESIKKVRQITKEKNELDQCLAEAQNQVSHLECMTSTLECDKQQLKSRMHRLQSQVRKAEEASRVSAANASSLDEGLKSKVAEHMESEEALEKENNTLRTAQQQLIMQLQESKKQVSKYQKESKRSWDLANQLQQELAVQETEQFKLSEELKLVTDQYQAAQRHVERLQVTAEDRQRDKRSLEEELSQMTRTIDELEQANFELSTQLSELGSVTTSQRNVSDESRTKCEELKRKLDATESVLLDKQSQLAELLLTNNLLEKENSTLLAQLDQISQSLAANNAECYDLRAQLGSHNRETRAIAAQITELEETHLQCEPKRAKLEEEVTSLQDQFQLAQDQLYQEKKSTASLKLEVKLLTDRQASLDYSTARLQEQLQTQTVQVDSHQAERVKQNNRIHQLEQQMKRKETALLSAQKESEEVRFDLKIANENSQEKVGQLDAKVEQLQESCELLLADKKQTSSRLLQLSMELEQQRQECAQAENECSMLASEVEKEKEQHSAQREERNHLQRQLRDAQKELSYYQKKVKEEACARESLECQHAQALRDFQALKEVFADGSMCYTPPKPKGILKKKSTTASRSGEVLQSVENINP